MKKYDFVEFYFKHKNRQGFLAHSKLERYFMPQKERYEFWPTKSFCDDTKKYFIKRVYQSGELDAEVMLSRLYAKLGFISPKYYPVKGKDYQYVVSKDISREDVVIARSFKKFIFSNGNIFPNVVGEDSFSGFYSKGAIRDLLKLRFLDAATINGDRHPSNYFFKIEKSGDVDIATGIGTIDYSSSGRNALECEEDINQWSFFSNFSDDSDKHYKSCMSTRDEMLSLYKQNELAREILPSGEMAEILGNVDFKTEAREIKEETNFLVNSQILDVWAHSFDQMAEELEQ